MSDLRKAAEQAVVMIYKVFEEVDGDEWPELYATLEQLKEALAKPEQEPVAWICHTKCVGEFIETNKKKADEFNDFFNDGLDCHATITPLYTKPQPLRRLSDEEQEAVLQDCTSHPEKHRGMFKIFSKAIQDAIEKINQSSES